MKQSEFLTMIAAGLLAVFFAPCCNAQSPCPTTIERDGHCFTVQFQSEIVTNPVMACIEWTNGIVCATNYSFYYYHPAPAEDPFPRTSQSTESFEVVSNTYLLFVFDGGTNRVSQHSVRLGTITRTSKTVISAQTNASSSESFEGTK